MIEHVFLDLDDTIFDFHAAEAIAIRKTLAQMGAPHTDDIVKLYSSINDAYWKKLERGEITRERLLTERFECLYRELELDISAELTRYTYRDLLAEQCIFIDGAEELLRALHGSYRLHAVTNGNVAVQTARIERSGVSKFFDHIFISESVGANKPSPLFFSRCIDAISGFDAHSGIIVGDSLSSDIAGGKNAGLVTCLFNPKNKEITGPIAPDYEISSLSELPPLLRRI